MSWPLVKLSDVCTLINGRAYKKPELFDSGKYPVLRVGNFFSNRGWYYSDLELPKKNYCDNGDLLYAWSASFGPRIWEGEKVIFHYHIWKIILDEKRVDKKYLYYALANDVEKIKLEQGSGSTIIHVTKAAMENRLIPLPPLPEQKRIAAILDKADQLRQKRQQAIGLAYEFLRSVFLDMFGDPVTNPKGWGKKELQDICQKIIDCPHSTPKWTASGIIGLRTSNLTKGGWKWDDTRYVSSETYATRTKRAELQANDIILSREGTVGIAALVPEDVKMCMGQRLVQLRVDTEHVLPEYMLFLLLYELDPERISRVMAGSTSKHLNVKDLRKLKIMLPSIEKQRAFVTVFLQKMKMDKILNLATDEKKLTFNSLSQKAFAGEL